MTTTLPEKRPTADLAADTAIFTSYLASFGLPVANVIATSEERSVVAANLPHFLDGLPPEEKKDARYLSKFVGATAIGLFDAALNYIWNEVILNLRRKIVIYGVDLFFDAAVGGTNRSSYKDEKDLGGLKDCVLLDTCRKLEIVSDIVYRKLDHILTMRNEVAASHPNVESIGGYELLGWLQTCVKDVLQDRPSESAIRIKSLVDNLKSRQDALDDLTTARFCDELRHLSPPHLHNLLITFFGLFVAKDTDQILRANIAKLGPSVWGFAEDRFRVRIGMMIDGYRTNLQKIQLDRGIEFLTLVDGRMYETLPAKLVALEALADRLEGAHGGLNNFYNEPPIMREILQFCRKLQDIPQEVLPKLVRVILRCRIGRGLSYCQGVSPMGGPLYDTFLGFLDDTGIIHCVIAFYVPEINCKLTNRICHEHLSDVLAILRPLAVSARLGEVLDYLIADIPNVFRATSKKDFLELSAPLIKWQ